MKELKFKNSYLTASSVGNNGESTLVFNVDEKGSHKLNKLNVGWEICKYNAHYVDFTGVSKSEMKAIDEFIDLYLTPDYPTIIFSINCYESKDRK